MQRLSIILHAYGKSSFALEMICLSSLYIFFVLETWILALCDDYVNMSIYIYICKFTIRKKMWLCIHIFTWYCYVVAHIYVYACKCALYFLSSLCVSPGIESSKCHPRGEEPGSFLATAITIAIVILKLSYTTNWYIWTPCHYLLLGRIRQLHCSDATQASRSFKSHTTRLFIQQFVQANSKENLSLTGPLWCKSTGDGWIPLT